jgi:hypothetical protein
MDIPKKNSSNDKTSSVQGSQRALTGIILLFDKLPKLDITKIAGAIAQIEPLKKPVRSNIQVEEGGILRAFVEFDDHRLQLVGFSARVPAATMEHTIPVSNWKPQDKALLQGHKAHILCYYEGENTNPVERLIALYKTAFAFCKEGVLGILDEDAWNCMPRRMIEEQVKPDMLQSCRQTVPLGIWTGFVKLFKSKTEVWFCTKGYHRFGAKDLAYLGRPDEANATYDLFGNLFFYMRDGAVLKAGDTAQVSETENIRFREVYEYPDSLNSPSGTLVLEKIKASEINKPGS